MEAVETRGRDAAEYVEASCEAEVPEDSLEDRVAEHFSGCKMPVATIGMIAQFVRAEVGNNSSDEVKKQSCEKLAVVLAHLMPPVETLIEYWTMHYAIGSPFVKDTTMTDFARFVGVSRRTINARILNWRKVVGMTTAADCGRSEAVRVGHKRRKT